MEPHRISGKSDAGWWRSVATATTAAVVLAVACFVAYWAWLGWDTTYQRDPRTGEQTGPYEAWQVAGCVLTLAVVATVAGRRQHDRTARLVMPVAFAVAWSLGAVRQDDSGLWPVGALSVWVGMTASVWLVAGWGSLTGRRANPSR